MNPPPLLELKNVTKSFGAVRALKGVTFDLRPGEVHALLGENGAGKSTLIKVITGAHAPDSGSINLDGKSIHHLNPSTAHGLGIAAIYQQPALFADLTVAENIALNLERPAACRWVNRRKQRECAEQLLRRVGADLDPETEVRELSMPEQQLVEIARALGAGARILILDEPTASLTAREVELLVKLIGELRSRGVGMVYISHRLPEVFQVADRVTVLRDGESVGTREVRASDGTPALTETELIRMMVGREVSTIFPPPESEPGEIVLALEGLGCREAGIGEISLEVRAGEILGLAGLVGAGRTELARILFGLTPADEGVIRLRGERLRIRSPREAVEAGIAYVPEDRRKHGVILDMSIAANITMGVHPKLFPGSLLRFKTERDVAQKYVEDLSIKTPSTETRAGNLSGGNQQKVALARWLVAKPKVLILDEPTQGVDVGAKAEIHKLIRKLAAQGLAVLMISSDLPEILAMSDRIAVMRGGRLNRVFNRTEANPDLVMAAALGQSMAEENR